MHTLVYENVVERVNSAQELKENQLKWQRETEEQKAMTQTKFRRVWSECF